MNRSFQSFELSQHDGELSALAADVGIDWQKAQDYLHWDGVLKKNVPPISKAYKGKVALASEILPSGRARITFTTLKHGGKSATWVSGKENNFQNNPLLHRARLKAQYDETKKAEYYELLNQQYIKSWKSASSPALDDFPYLKRKGLQDSGLKQLSEKDGRKFLAIPLFRNGQISGLQRIYEDGYKKLTPGAKITGAYCLIGANSLSGLKKVYIAEGWATARTIYELTGVPVLCAFTANNLKTIAELALRSLDGKNIIIAADNDQFKNGNAGLLNALEISYNLKIKVRYPNFKGIEFSNKPTDFNDLFLLAGPEETLRQLTKSRKSILRSAPNALEFRLKKLSYSPKISSPNNRLLKSTISQAIRKDYTDKEIVGLIRKFTRSIEEVVIRKSIRKVRSGVARRVAKCHLINPKRHPEAQFIDLPLTRQDHGGYLIDENFYYDLREFEGIIIVKSPMGSAKTERVLAKAVAQAEKACYITHRIGLTEEGSQRLGIQSYRDVSRLEMGHVDKLGCCINSLNNPKFSDGDWFLDCDLVAIDEGTKVLSHLAGKTIDNPDGITNTLLCAMKLSKQTIICDADANDTLVELVQKLTGKPVLVAQSSPKMDHIGITLTNIWDGFARVFEAASSGEKVLVACDSKNDVKKVKRKLEKKNLKVLGIHSESKIEPEVDKWSKNPNEESENWDVVVYNSTIDSGISIVSNHFDVHVGLFRGVISPQAVIQMTGRDRTAREWLVGCSPVVATRYGNDFESRYRALASAALKIKWEEGNKASEVPPLSHYDTIRLGMQEDSLRSCQDYFLTLATMYSQKGYKVSTKRPEEELLKDLKREISALGEEIRSEFIQLILNTVTPQHHRYRKLKQAYAISEDELAEVIRFEMRQSLGVYSISEDDVIFWLENHDRRELWFELIKTDRQKLLEFDLWNSGQTPSLSRRKNLIVKADLINKLFETLGLDPETGEGAFTHKDCSRFIAWVKENQNRLVNFNEFIGPHLFCDTDPLCPTKFVLKILEKLGLNTRQKLSGRKRLSMHSLCPESWKVMMTYYENRKSREINIANLPPEALKDNSSEMAGTIKHPHTEAPSGKEPINEASETISCSDCHEEVDHTAIKWQFDRCSSCHNQYLGISSA